MEAPCCKVYAADQQYGIFSSANAEAPYAINTAALTRLLGWPQVFNCSEDGFDTPTAAKLGRCGIKKHDNGTVTAWIKWQGALALCGARNVWHNHCIEIRPAS
jgi:hypothetical protein